MKKIVASILMILISIILVQRASAGIKEGELFGFKIGDVYTGPQNATYISTHPKRFTKVYIHVTPKTNKIYSISGYCETDCGTYYLPIVTKLLSKNPTRIKNGNHWWNIQVDEDILLLLVNKTTLSLSSKKLIEQSIEEEEQLNKEDRLKGIK